MNTKIRAEVLESAQKRVCDDRNNQYGEPEDNFEVIANLWRIYLQALPYSVDKLNATDVANMMILFKVGRLATAIEPTPDTYVDIAGYAACGAEIEVSENVKD